MDYFQHFNLSRVLNIPGAAASTRRHHRPEQTHQLLLLRQNPFQKAQEVQFPVVTRLRVVQARASRVEVEVADAARVGDAAVAGIAARVALGSGDGVRRREEGERVVRVGFVVRGLGEIGARFVEEKVAAISGVALAEEVDFAG
nr:hypothetical protein Iba_scaffold17214CG0040 [Ipomoea batatas]